MAAINKTQAIVDAARSQKDRGSSDFSDVYQGIVQLQQKDKDPAKLSADMTSLNARLHQSGILTDLQITGIDEHNHLLAIQNGRQVEIVASNSADVFQAGAEKTSFLQGLENVGAEAGQGAVNELTHHFGHVVESAAIGLGVGTVAALASPALALTVGALGIGYAGYQLITHIPGWVQDAEIVANPELYSKNELAQADHGIRGLGAGAVDVAAGVAGGVAGGYLGSAIKAGLLAKPLDLPDSDPTPRSEPEDTVHHAHMQQGTIANTTGQIGDPSQGSATVGDGGQGGQAVGAQPIGDPSQGAGPSLDNGHAVGHGVIAHATATHAAGATGGSSDAMPDSVLPDSAPAISPDVKVSPAEISASPAVKVSSSEGSVNTDASVALTPEQIALQQSIAQNQSIFDAANSSDEGGVITAQKQDYNVLFKRITEPGTIQTLENRGGEPVVPGQWVAIRLQPDGQPVVEDGIVNQWPVVEKTILKAYKTTPDQLQGVSELIAGTKTDAPPVHMVQLDHDITIKTPWGSMSGKAGDWLANYDYNATTKIPGEDFAIVTNTSFKQTYEPVPTS